jgi:hypothetical protein
MINSTVNNSISPSWLPQINDEYIEELLKELEDNGVIVKKIMISPKFLIPTQNKVQSKKIDNFNKIVDNDEYLPQIWVDANNNVIDGHHRLYTYLTRSDIDKVECIKLFVNIQDACRMINKFIDRKEFKEEFDINEVFDSEKYKKFLQSDVEETDEEEIDEEKTDSENDLNFDEVKNEDDKTYVLYSTRPLNPKSPTGSLLSMEQGDGYTREYEIEFDNMLTVPLSDMELYEPFYLSAIYIMDPNFEKDIKRLKKMASTANQTVSEFTKSQANSIGKRQGFDGINFGNKLVLIITQ